MCMGLPMQIIESGFGSAICDYNGEQRQIDTMLIGQQEPGTWILVFVEAAREVIDEQTALQIRDALQALDMVMGGDDNIDHLFSDLTGVGVPSIEKEGDT